MPASVQNIQEAERLQEEGEGNPWWRDPACVSAELAAVRQQSNVRVGDHMVVTWRRDQGVMEQPTPPAEILSPAPASVTSRQCSSAAAALLVGKTFVFLQTYRPQLDDLSLAIIKNLDIRLIRTIR